MDLSRTYLLFYVYVNIFFNNYKFIGRYYSPQPELDQLETLKISLSQIKSGVTFYFRSLEIIQDSFL